MGESVDDATLLIEEGDLGLVVSQLVVVWRKRGLVENQIDGGFRLLGGLPLEFEVVQRRCLQPFLFPVL